MTLVGPLCDYSVTPSKLQRAFPQANMAFCMDMVRRAFNHPELGKGTWEAASYSAVYLGDQYLKI